MRFLPTELPDVRIIEPVSFSDDRGFFFECWNEAAFRAAGIEATFVQDNHSRSIRNVLRGLHYQTSQAQGKLVRCVFGTIFDVVVDLRRSSQSFGKWFGVELSAANRRMVWIPAGFAHGLLVTSEHAEVIYKVTQFWAPQYERTIAWNDSVLAIRWPIEGDPILSAKDARGMAFENAPTFD